MYAGSLIFSFLSKLEVCARDCENQILFTFAVVCSPDELRLKREKEDVVTNIKSFTIRYPASAYQMIWKQFLFWNVPGENDK
jgi:hypothetical protein